MQAWRQCGKGFVELLEMKGKAVMLLRPLQQTNGVLVFESCVLCPPSQHFSRLSVWVQGGPSPAQVEDLAVPSGVARPGTACPWGAVPS